MKNRKLWLLLTSLSPKEQAQFARWLEMEMDGRQEYKRTLNSFLLSQIPTPPPTHLVWEHLYRDKPYDDARLRKLIRDLSAQVEEFMAILAFRKNKRLKEAFLLQEMNTRDIGPVFEKRITKIRKSIAAKSFKNGEDFYQWYLIEKEAWRFNVKHRRPPKLIEIEGQDKMSEMQLINYLYDNWWISIKLKLALGNLVYERKQGKSIESILLPEIEKSIQEHSFFHAQPRIQIYLKMLRLLKGEEKGNFTELLTLIQTHKTSIDFAELQQLNALLLNYFIGKLNTTGDETAAWRIFDLFEWAIEDRLILLDGILPRIYYKNLITICIRVSNFDKAWEYMHLLKPLLEESKREIIFNNLMIYFFFAKKEFSKVIEITVDTRFQQGNDEVDARTYMLQAHFELGESDLDWLYNQVETLIRYVRNQKKLSHSQKQPYLNRLKLFKRLINLKTSIELRKLEKAVKETQPIDRPEWLLEKIREKLSLLS